MKSFYFDFNNAVFNLKHQHKSAQNNNKNLRVLDMKFSNFHFNNTVHNLNERKKL
jgi:hypothetical protein